MNFLIQKLQRLSQEFSSQDHGGSGPIANHVILCLGHLYDHLSRWMFHINLFQNDSAIVSYLDVTHTTDEHLVHAPRTQSSLYGFGNNSGRHYVVSLGLFPPTSTSSLPQNENGLSRFRCC